MSKSPNKTRTFDRSLVEGPIGPAVWRIAWPTMLQNVIAGLQGIIDHAMVGHFVGYTANAAIGVSWQIVLVVIVFASSVFSGMGVLVARFAGANDHEKVNRVVYQAFLTAAGMSVILGAVGWLTAPALLDLVNAAPAVKAEALPFLRAMFLGSMGRQRIKFMDMLAVVVENLERLDQVVASVWQLGKRHAGYGVKEKHYDVVREALLGAFDEELGDAFPSETREAWGALFDLIATAMKQAGAEGPLSRP